MTTTRTGRTTVLEQRPAAQQTNANDDGDDPVGAGLQQASQTAERGEGDPQAARRGESGNVGQDGQREGQHDGVRVEPDRQQAMLAAIQQLTMALGTQQTAAVGQDRAREAPSTETVTIMAGIQQLAAMVSSLGTAPTVGRDAEPAQLARTGVDSSVIAGRTRSSGPPPNDGNDPSGSDSDGDFHFGADSDGDDGDDDLGDPSSSSSSSSNPSSSSSSSDGEDAGKPRGRAARQEQRRRHGKQPRRQSIKNLELPAYTPSPRTSVSTWIDRMDLALKGARESGQGRWSDRALYFILGNKLMDDAAKWWVDQDRRLNKRKQTWTYLKKALLVRYGSKLDKSAAELRVTMRMLMPGETYADFAAGLRSVVGRNKVSERMLLAQFYRCLDKTTRKLVKQKPVPKVLEEAVAKATEIDDPLDNVAQGMANIGQPWAVAPSSFLMPVAGTTGPLTVIPGISGTGLPTEVPPASVSSMTVIGDDGSGVALFTNPQGVYNPLSGTWDGVPHRYWNGKFWEVKGNGVKQSPTRQQAEPKQPANRKVKRREAVESSGDESDVNPPRKKLKAAVRQSTGTPSTMEVQNNSPSTSGLAKSIGGAPLRKSVGACLICGQEGHWAVACPNKTAQCFACHQPGHFARECPDPAAKAKNDAYLASRAQQSKHEENE